MVCYNFLPVAGPISQISNACFFLSALVCDVLLIRFCLVGAFVTLFTSAMLGFPAWPSVEDTGNIAVDVVLWASIGMAFHGLAFFRLLWDERAIRFASDDEEQLWRFFSRRGGMGRLEMKQALRHGRWVRVRAGQLIARGPEARLHFFVLVEGRATISSTHHGIKSEPRALISGNCFDMGLLSVFGVFNGMVTHEEHVDATVADTDCLLYRWTVDELAAIATQTAPAVGAFFRNFTLAQLGSYLGHRLYPHQDLVCATGELEPEGIMTGAVRSRDFTDPLRPYEQQTMTLKGFLCWLRRSFNPFPPPGLRHTDLPVTGILARNRLVAQKAAKAKAAIEAADAATGDALDEEQLALEILQRMQTLAALDSMSIDALLETAASLTTEMRLGSAPLSASSGRQRSQAISGFLAAHPAAAAGAPAAPARSRRGLLAPASPGGTAASRSREALLTPFLQNV